MVDATNADGGEQSFLWLSDIHFDPHYSTSQAFITRHTPNRFPNANCDLEDASYISGHGCDASRSLVKSALEYAASVTSAPSFVVITGDLIRHGVDQLFKKGDFHEGGETHESNASKANAAVEEAANSPYHAMAKDIAGEILHDVVSMVQAAFPETEIIVSIGNNDVVPDYYLQLQDEDSPLGSSNLTVEDAGMVGVIFNALSDSGSGSDSNSTTIITEDGPKQFERTTPTKSILTSNDEWTFLRGGYYSRNLHGGRLTVLSLNTVLYSSYFSPTPENVDDPGWQFEWMRKILGLCREIGTQAMIVGHIPPAVGSYRHTQLWKDQYVQTYYEIVKEFEEVITAQLFGHLHSDEFRVGLADDSNAAYYTEMIPSIKTPLLLAGSITPLHGNNPSIRLVKYGYLGDGGSNEMWKYKMLDYESHQYSMGTENQWAKLYTFSEAYSQASDIIKDEGLSSNSFRAIVESMEDKRGKESPVLESYRTLMLSRAEGDGNGGRGENVPCDIRCRDEIMCTLTSATSSGYDNCLVKRQLAWRSNGRSIFGLVGAVLFATVLIAFIVFRCCRKRSKRDDYESTPSVHRNGSIEEVDTMDQEVI